MLTFSDLICKNIDQLADAAVRTGDQKYVDQYLDNFWAFYERINGRSGLSERPMNYDPACATLALK